MFILLLQATTLGDFPAPISLCAITSFIGVFITAAVQFIQDHKIETGWPLVSARDLIGFSLLVSMIFVVFIFETQSQHY